LSNILSKTCCINKCRNHKNGRLLEEKEYKYGNVHGIWNKYLHDGVPIFKTQTVNEECHGPITAYYESGRINITSNFKYGLKHGKWIIYNEDGSIKKEIDYLDNQAQNQEELDSIESKYLNDIEEMRGEILDPEDFLDDPTKYLFKKGNF